MVKKDLLNPSLTYVVGYNNITNESGLKPINMDGNFDPVKPVMVVHDLLEHFPGAGDSVEAEFMALGAALWIRVEGGYFPDEEGGIKKLAEAPFEMLFHHIAHKDHLRAKPYRKRRHGPNTKFTHGWAEVQDKIVRVLAFARLNHVWNGTYNTRHPKHRVVLEESYKAEKWMLYGYWKAKFERYHGFSPFHVCAVYKRAQKLLENTVRYEEADRLYELSIDVQTGSCNLSIQDAPPPIDDPFKEDFKDDKYFTINQQKASPSRYIFNPTANPLLDPEEYRKLVYKQGKF